MKIQTIAISLFLTSLFLLFSCSDNDLVIETPTCDFQSDSIVIEPLCNFNPKVFQNVPIPVRVLYNGEAVVSHPEYTFSWSSDLDFGGSAISVTYGQLPLTVVVLENATDCEATATLNVSYWE